MLVRLSCQVYDEYSKGCFISEGIGGRIDRNDLGIIQPTRNVNTWPLSNILLAKRILWSSNRNYSQGILDSCKN